MRAIGLVTGEPCAHRRTVCLNSSRGCIEQVKCHQSPEESLVSAPLFLKQLLGKQQDLCFPHTKIMLLNLKEETV